MLAMTLSRRPHALPLLLLLVAAALSCRRAEPPQPFKPLAHTFEAPAQRDTFLCPRILSTQSYALKGCVPDPCTKGDVPVEGVPGACCAEGQTFDEQKLQCVGEGVCPQGMITGTGGCYFEDRDQQRAYTQQQCEQEDNLHACYSWAASLLSGFDVPRDTDKARAITERLCARGHIEGCALLAFTHLRFDAPGPRDVDLVRELNELSCRGGSDSGCGNLAWSHEQREEHEEAAKWLRFSCEQTGRGCDRAAKREALARRSREGDEAFLAMARKGCVDERKVLDCYEYTRHAAEIERIPRREVLRSIEPRDQPWCHDDDTGECEYAVYRAVELGELPKKEHLDALRLKCDEGHYNMCVSLTFLLKESAPLHATSREREQTLKEAERRGRRACEEGRRGRACESLAETHALSGKGAEQAREYYAKACELYMRDTCAKGGDLWLEQYERTKAQPALEKARDLYERSCELHEARGCFELGKIYYTPRLEGLDEEQSYAMSYAIFDFACHRFEEASSCYFVSGHPHVKGEEEEEKASRIYDVLGCLFNQGWACADMLKTDRGGPEELHEQMGEAAEGVMARRLERAERRNNSDWLRANRSFEQADLVTEGLIHMSHSVSSCSESSKSKQQCARQSKRADALYAVSYERARLGCEQGDAASCHQAGRMSLNALGAPRGGAEEFTPWYERACALGHPTACNWLGRHLLYGFEDVERDFHKAAEFNARQCELSMSHSWRAEDAGFVSWCENYVMATAHAGVDVVAVVDRILAGCDEPAREAYATRCREQAHDFVHALAPFYDEPLEAYFEERCATTNAARTCVAHARVLSEREPERARAIALAQCERDEEEADCSELGRQLLGEDRDQARAILKRECEQSGGRRGCADLGGHLLGSEHISEQAAGREALERGCEAYEARACTLLGELYQGSGSVAKDAKRAREFSRKACNLYDYRACEQL